MSSVLAECSMLLEESLLLTKVYLAVRQNVSWLIQSSVTTHAPCSTMYLFKLFVLFREEFIHIQIIFLALTGAQGEAMSSIHP